MRNITLQTLRDWDACSKGYDKIAEHVKEGEVITLDLALRVVEVEDVVWALAYDPDRYRWLSFLADMIDLPGCEAIVQAVRGYRDVKIPSSDLETVATDARLSAINAHVTINARDARAAANVYAARATAYTAFRATACTASYGTAYTAAYTARAASDASHAAAGAVSIGDKPRLIKLIRSHYQ